MSEIVLVNVTGSDRPGITASLTAIMGRYHLNVLDIGQAVIHDNLAWGMLVEIPPQASDSALFKELMFEAHRLGLNMHVTPVSEAEYSRWVGQQGRSRHVITVLGKQIRAEHICRVAELIAVGGLNIDRINRLSGRALLSTPEHKRRAAIDFHVRGDVKDLSVMHATFLQLSQSLDIDVAIQEDNVFRRNRRLVCFDMDSTLIQNEVIDELARVAGVGDEVGRITARAMAGELDFKESFTRRLALLRGLAEEELEKVAESVRVTDGAEALVRTLKHYRFRTAIISGGFTWFARRLKERLGIDYVYANELEIVDGRLTGKVVGEIIDEDRKAELLCTIAEREGIRLEQVIAVGDGANDLKMLSIAGLGIAFRAKPVVRRQARLALGASSLDSILYLIGMRERDFRHLPETAST